MARARKLKQLILSQMVTGSSQAQNVPVLGWSHAPTNGGTRVLSEKAAPIVRVA